MKRRGLDLVFLHPGLAGLILVGCFPPGSTDEPDRIRPAVWMTADDCTQGSVGGKVGVCHATGSSSNPYVHIEVSTNACINGHAKKHEQDFVSSDSSCVRCGDGIVAGGETCDPPSSCPTSCADGNSCTIDSMSGSPSTCDVTCGHSAVTQCASGDGCCAAGCDANSDGDCVPSCGNGVVESGETCDPPSSCPTTCTDPDPCILPGVLTGSAADCTAACAFGAPYACDDGLECTADTCNGDGTCGFAIIPGNCIADGVCHAGGHGPVDPQPADPTSNEPISISLSSPYLDVDLSWDGRFTAGALQPAAWSILYGWPGNPWTTSATVRVDGDDVHFGEFGYDNQFLQYPYDAGNAIAVARWRTGPIVVTQTLRIGVSTSSGNADMLKIQYDLANIDEIAHQVGMRMLMDTEINRFDGAPFRVPGMSGAITTETEFLGSAVPEYYQAFFDLNDPLHVVQGTLGGADATLPDRLAMVDWYNASASYWDYEVTPGRPFGNPMVPDSGVLLYWNPEPIEAGATRRYVTYYGLGALSGSATLALSGPARLGLTDNAWSPNPFTVIAYLKNPSLANKTGETLTLAFDESGGLALAAGETATNALPDIAPGATVQSAWRVQPLATGTWGYGVSTGSSPTLSAQRTVAVPQPWQCVP